MLEVSKLDLRSLINLSGAACDKVRLSKAAFASGSRCAKHGDRKGVVDSGSQRAVTQTPNGVALQSITSGCC